MPVCSRLAWLLLLTLTQCTPSPLQDPGGAPVTASTPMPGTASTPLRPRNVILVVADGLRAGMVRPDTAPTLYGLSHAGVAFPNSHSLFPTFTTTNAAAIATGHYPGDTSDFSNNIYIGYPLFSGGHFPGTAPGTYVPFLEHNQVLGDVNMHVEGENFLDEESLLSLARAHGYRTAAVGKLGPALLQDVTMGNPRRGVVPPPATVIIDDLTGRPGGVPVPAPVAARLKASGLPLVTPSRDNHAPGTPLDNGRRGNAHAPGTKAANLVQQAYFVDVLTKVLLPEFVAARTGFVIVYWSRDPDGTHHHQGDSLGKTVPGINGPTSLAAIRNVDDNVRRLLEALQATPEMAANTDIVVTSDHGFSTISRHDLDATGQHATRAYAATLSYGGADGRPEVLPGHLPPGFVAIDLAHALGLPLYDADHTYQTKDGGRHFLRVEPGNARATGRVGFPQNGHGLLGGSGRMLPRPDAAAIITANGGSDLIYAPGHDANLVRRMAAFLVEQDYVSGLFVDDDYGPVPGALPLSAINLKGHALLPTPALVVNFKSFSSDPRQPLTTQVVIADTTLQQGQGMHGSFGRGDTFNFMAASGPDFKAGFSDLAPVSNADLTVTLSHVLGFKRPEVGVLSGRVLREALLAGPATVPFAHHTRRSTAAANGMVTQLDYQSVGGEAGDRHYFDAAGFAGRSVGLSTPD